MDYRTNKEENTLYKVWLTLCWAFGFHYKLYRESAPKIGDVDVTMQRLAMIFSKGRLTWGKTALSECKCKVCGRKFWTLSWKSVVCKRYGCYMTFHLFPERYALARSKKVR